MARVRTDIAVAALVRRAHGAGAFAVVAARGDEHAGAMVVKVADMAGRAQVWSSMAGSDGEPVWFTPLSHGEGGGDAWPLEADVDAYLARLQDRDPDVWIVEIEDTKARDFTLATFDQPD